MKKPKPGKKKHPKAAKRSRTPSAKPSPAPAADQQAAGAHLDAPSAVEHPNHDKPSHDPADEFAGKVAVISKGAERIPVQLKSEAHLAELRSKHGAGHVEVQS